MAANRFTPVGLPTQCVSLALLACRHPRSLRIRSHLTPRERAVLYALARRVGREGLIAEIGSYLGASACALAAGMKDAGSVGSLVCIDTWKNDAMTEGACDTWDTFCINTARYRSLIRPVRGFSHEAIADAVNAAKGLWSLLFFDGDHSAEGARRDWDAYRPHLAPGAIVVFHDIGWAQGVQHLVTSAVLPQLIGSCRLPNLFWGQLR